MARIQLRNLAHSYRPNPSKPADYALQPLDLDWEDGGAYALLGPSGSGKTTMLSILSGLLSPSAGQLLFDGVDVTKQTTRERNIAQVFQFPVIYDTMSVYDNLAFPLRNRRVDAATIRRRVEQVADILDLTAELPRRAAGLTADAKQRISMGRGLVRQDVAAILFDEPLTVIDPALKWVLRRKLKQIHSELKVTLIYVTHDQTEALTFADRVVVMESGAVLQQGTPQELFERPSHTFVAHFIGSPGMNLLRGSVAGNLFAIGQQRVALAAAPQMAAGATATLGIRPEFVSLDDPGGAAPVAIAVSEVEALGGHQIVHATLEGQRFVFKIGADDDIAAGPATVWLPQRWLRLYSDDRLVG